MFLQFSNYRRKTPITVSKIERNEDFGRNYLYLFSCHLGEMIAFFSVTCEDKKSLILLNTKNSNEHVFCDIFINQRDTNSWRDTDPLLREG